MAADINRSRVYVTLGSNRIAEINPTNLSGMTSLTQTSPNQWGPLQRPNGLVVANDGFVYVANQGDLSGNSGYISKINAATGTTEVFFSETVGDWGELPVGFCNPTGVTIDSGQQYLFVTNSDCSQSYSGYGNRNRILKIRLP
jgi:DNA-binding beta-propeller fold protein YncE